MSTVPGQAGKSLVEIMTIVSVLGIATMITAEAWLPATSRNQALAVRAELAGELRVARHMAMARGRTVRARLEAGRSQVVIRISDREMELRTLDFSDKGVVIESVSGGPEILFHGSGRASTPTTIVLKNVNDERLYKLTVSITGRVTLK